MDKKLLSVTAAIYIHPGVVKCLGSLFFRVPDPRETCILPVNTVSPCLSTMIDDPYR
jgi:hypothetical protein